MSRMNRQAGFGHVAMVLVVLVFGAIGAIGYTLYANPARNEQAQQQGAVKRTDPRSTEATLNVPAAPQIKSASDLDRAMTVLNEVDPGSASEADNKQLDRQLEAF